MLPVLLLFLLLPLPPSVASPPTDPSDAAAMLDLLRVLPTAASSLGWSPSLDPCSWSRVSCSSGRATAVLLGSLSLPGGPLPPSLSNLTALVRLELQFNSLAGPLPSLRGLSSLHTLLLHHNRFTSLPADFFLGLSSLQSLSLDSNPFAPWDLPASIRDAAALVNISANSCGLRGSFPAALAGDAFPGLAHVGLAYNLLSGPLPAALAGSSIVTLWLNNQQGESGVLSGSIDVVANMTNLVQLWLHSNNFSGAIPDLSGLRSLRDLNLRDNRLTGPVPASLLQLTSLQNLSLTNNLLQGPVPAFPPGVRVDMTPASESFCRVDPGAACDPRVDALLAAVAGFGYPASFASDWKGNDPCAGWLGVSCDAFGNVTVVNFRAMGLSGYISPAFSRLRSLRRLLLSGNHLTGSIPPELAGLAALEKLDLSANSLSGDIPPGFRKGVQINVDGNPMMGRLNSSAVADKSPPSGGVSTAPDVAGEPREAGHRRSSSAAPVAIAASAIGGAALVLCLGLLGFYVYKKRRLEGGTARGSGAATVIHPRRSSPDEDMVKITVAGAAAAPSAGSLSASSSAVSENAHVVESGNMVISIQVLRSVTGNFSDRNVVGRGGFGTVYRGELHDGTKIAVKRMEACAVGSKGMSEFEWEIAVLTKVRHRHLVSLLGYCLDGCERLLAYEYMPQGPLSRHLFEWRQEGVRPLEWKRRLGVALDVARGVEYLHGLAHQSFIHRDLKPSNILLGDDMRAKVADFGLVRLAAPDGKCSVETRLAGTFGYLAPEYAVTGRVTTKADVFSFGVILMELITGRKALDESQPEDSMHLVTWFKRMQLTKETSRKAIDPVIELDEETVASIDTVAELAGHCCTREPYQRPDMGHAVNVLSSLVEMWKPSDPESDESYGIDFDMTLPQALKKWQAFEDSVGSNAVASSFLASVDNTQTSIPTRPSGFADSFTSADGR